MPMYEHAAGGLPTHRVQDLGFGSYDLVESPYTVGHLNELLLSYYSSLTALLKAPWILITTARTDSSSIAVFFCRQGTSVVLELLGAAWCGGENASQCEERDVAAFVIGGYCLPG